MLLVLYVRAVKHQFLLLFFYEIARVSPSSLNGRENKVYVHYIEHQQ